MKIRALKFKNKINSVYNYGDTIIMCPVNDNYHLTGYSTYCKEELGAAAVKGKRSKFVISLPKKLSDARLKKILRIVNAKEKKAKVKATYFEKVEDRDRWTLVNHSPRWSRNSVAHSILLTWIRYEMVKEFLHLDYEQETDAAHLKSCSWLLNIIKMKGLGIFGTIQHTKYDMGMVSFVHRLGLKGRDGIGGEGPPVRSDFSTIEDYWAAYDGYENIEWGDGSSEFVNIGDMDNDLPKGKHAYTKLIEMYNGIKI